MKFPLSSTNTLLRTLEHCGFLVHDGRKRGRFHLTSKIMALAHRAQAQMSMTRVAEPYLQILAKESGFTTILAVREQDRMVYVAKAEGDSAVRLAAYVGKTVPLHCSATGRALLAHLPREQAHEILKDVKLTRLTPHTVTTLEKLYAELDRTRQRGYSEDHEEYALGIEGLGAPVFDHSGVARAAVVIAGAPYEFADRRRKLIKAVLECARQISRQLGG